MKRRISILIIAFVLFAIPAWAIYQSSTFGNRSGVAAVGGGGSDYTEDCADISDWTNQVSSTFAASGGQCDPGADYEFMTANTALSSTAYQAIKAQVVNTLPATIWLALRLDGSGNGYTAKFETGDMKVFDTTGWTESFTQSFTMTGSLTFPSSNYYIGFEVLGTGNDTIMYMWVWASDPGDWDTAHTNWGSPNLTGTDDPDTPRNTGTYSGIGMYDAWQGGAFDNITAYSSN